MSRKFKIRKVIGNFDFLDYKPKEFWKNREGGLNRKTFDWHKDFLKIVKEENLQTALELGAGAGNNIQRLKTNFKQFVGLDIAPKGKEILEADITKGWLQKADIILCALILMHIPPKDIDFVIRTIKNSCNHVFVYDTIKSQKEGLRDSNNFVFYYDHIKLFNDWKLVFAKEYADKNYGFCFKKEGGI